MTDIVKRLRRQVIESPYEGFVSPLEAADEIERLRAALREIVDREADASGGARLSDFHDIRCACGRCAADIARAALEGKDD